MAGFDLLLSAPLEIMFVALMSPAPPHGHCGFLRLGVFLSARCPCNLIYVLGYVGFCSKVFPCTEPELFVGRALYRGTSLMKNSPALGPYGKTMLRALWWS